jgi:predicted DNA-binding protein
MVRPKTICDKGKIMRVPAEMRDYLSELNKQTGIPIPTIMREIARMKPITAERRR